MKGEVVVHYRPKTVAAATVFLPPEAVIDSTRSKAWRLSNRFAMDFTPALEPETGLLMTGSAGVPATEEDGVSSLARVVRAPAEEDGAIGVVESLLADAEVEAAYFKPPAEPASINEMTAAPTEPAGSLDFALEQGYLRGAPDGVDAAWASGIPGGKGSGVRVIDVEGQWRFSHECFRNRMGGTLSASVLDDPRWRNHGTAVLGVLWGQGKTLTGIAPDSECRGVSIDKIGSAAALLLAGEFLGPGDLLLIELHRAGPRHNFTSPSGQQGYIAIEWWPDDGAAIRTLVSRGIIVIGAAGNGEQDLDDPLYSVRPASGAFVFPPGWVNPFRRGAATTLAGALVGAGAPPSGAHGPDRSRLDFSNYGSAVDAQGWGRDVVTAGYGDRQGGTDEDYWYTGQFSGTSSASPIVVGSVACIQGHLRACGVQPLTLDEVIQTLRATGSPQEPNLPTYPVSQRIGNRPDLRSAVNHARSLRGLAAIP